MAIASREEHKGQEGETQDVIEGVMKKKRRVVQSIRSKRVATQERYWHNGGDIELHLYARGSLLQLRLQTPL